MLFLQLLVGLCDFLLCLVMWWVTLVDFQMLNQPFPSGVNRTWSWCIQRRQWRPTPVLLPGKPHGRRSLAGCSPWGPEEADTTERLHSHFFPALEKEMATHSRVLAWRIPGTEEPGGLPSMGSHRVGHNWSDLAAAAWCINILIFGEILFANISLRILAFVF